MASTDEKNLAGYAAADMEKTSSNDAFDHGGQRKGSVVNAEVLTGEIYDHRYVGS